MRVGFTGTQRGMTVAQKALLTNNLVSLEARLLLHGACIGADNEADLIAAELCIDRHAYPCTIRAKSMPEKILRERSQLCGLIYEKAPVAPLIRNRFIVQKCQHLIACPGEEHEVLRSGTWATIRYARKIGRDHFIIYPSGRMDISARG